MEHCAWLAAWAARRASPALALPIGIATFLVSNALVFLNSRWSFRYFEEPILRLKTRFKTSDSELPIPGEYGDISRAAAAARDPQVVAPRPELWVRSRVWGRVPFIVEYESLHGLKIGSTLPSP